MNTTEAIALIRELAPMLDAGEVEDIEHHIRLLSGAGTVVADRMSYVLARVAEVSTSQGPATWRWVAEREAHRKLTLAGDLRIARNEIEGLKALHGAAEQECVAHKTRFDECDRQRIALVDQVIELGGKPTTEFSYVEAAAALLSAAEDKVANLEQQVTDWQHVTGCESVDQAKTKREREQVEREGLAFRVTELESCARELVSEAFDGSGSATSAHNSMRALEKLAALVSKEGGA